MSVTKIVAIILIVIGILGLIYGGITYTKKTHDVDLGPVEFSVKEKETVNVPVWAGVAAVISGVLLLLVPRKK